MSLRDVLSLVSGTVTLVNGSAAGIVFAGLTASAARIGQALVVSAECTWAPTGERMRMPTLILAVANVSLAMIPATSLLVEAYESAGIAATAVLSPRGVATFTGADAQCSWRTIAATSSVIVLAAASSAASWTIGAGGAVVGGQPLALTVEGPPGATLTLQLVCSMWGGNTVTSPPLNVTTRAYTVKLGSASTIRTVWPSGTSVVLSWMPALAVTAPARYVLTCSLSLAGAVMPPATLRPGVGLGLPDETVQLVGEASVSVSLGAAATSANVSLPRVGLRAPGGSNASLVLTCRDGVGRSAALGVPISVRVAALTATWANATVAAMPSVVVPGQALPALTLTVASSPAVSLPTNVDVSSLLTCVAGVFRASPPLPLSMPLATLIASASPFVSASSATSGATITTRADNSSILVTLPPLSTTPCPLATQLTVAAECTWTPTGERVRLPPLATSTLQLALFWAAPPAIVLAYTPLALHLAASIVGAPATGISGAATNASCEVLLVNASMSSVRLVAAPWVLMVDGSASGGATMPMEVNATVQAPPATQLFITTTCTLWGQVLATPPLYLTTASLEARILSTLPSTFIASDASSPWPLKPPLRLAVVMRHNDGVVVDVACSVVASTPATDLVVVDDSTALLSLRSIPADEQTGTVAAPQFVVQTSPATHNVTLVVDCQHLASGDAVPPVPFTIPATLLTAQLCVPPARKAAVGDPLPPFSVGVAVMVPGGTPTSPCDFTSNTTTQHPITPLPSIVCTIALNASATTTNDTSSVFLQHTAMITSATTHVATFDDFTLVVPQGQRYGLRLTCAVGGLAIPPTLAFSVEVDGCLAGQASETVACVTCGGGEFSLGGKDARCTGCPPVGATCVSGIITLLPHYFRPAAQAGVPLGPTTELHPCYNAEACTLEYGGGGNVSSDASTAIYGCAYGYSGPLCGVCDAGVNYARFGEACALCWDASVSLTFLTAILLLVLTVLTRVALRKESGRSDASIVLRIMLGYLQAVGSLRVIRAGSTKAYDSVMGWTEVVSASPLSVGSLQCILRLPYLVQYVATIALPVLAAAIVVVIFHVVTTGRALRCKPRCGFDVLALKAAVSAWWASKRHLSTLLFVLFLAYMPIVSVSLRALDCIDPVAGIRYLRSDLSVECGVGQHAAVRVLAYTVLVMLGFGFPAGLAWLLGTARNDQLADVAFHATWGFLFDGYRAPTRTLVASPLPVTPVPVLAKDSGSSREPLSRDMRSSFRKLLSAPTPVKASKDATDGTGNSKFVIASPLGPPGATIARSVRRLSLVPAAEALTQAWVVAGDSRVWWEAIVLCRKTGVVLLAVSVTNPYLQCAGASLWFLGALLLQLRYTPYTKQLFNVLETASLASTLLTAIISTALLQYNAGVASTADLHPPDSMTVIEWVVTVLLVVLNVGTLIILAGLWLRAQCVRARSAVRRASLATALSGRVAGMRASLSRRRSSVAAGVVFSAMLPLLAPPLPPARSFSSDCDDPPADGAATGTTGTTRGVADGAPLADTENPLRARATPACAPPAPAVRVAVRQRAAPLRVTAIANDTPDAPSAVASRRHVISAATPAATPDMSTSTIAFAATPIGRSRRR